MTTTTIAPDKLDWLKTIQFGTGSHPEGDGYCIEEALNCALGNPISDDCPDCVDPMIHRAAIRVNDSWFWTSDAERTKVLFPLLLAQVGTRTDDKAVQLARRTLLVDFAIHRAVPTWLRRAKLDDWAAKCAALPAWSEETRPAIHATLCRAQASAYAAAASAADAASASVYAADTYTLYGAYAATDAAADADADARPTTKALLTEFVAVLIATCRVSADASKERTDG